MTGAGSSWQPTPKLRQLLFTDFDGEPADPDDVIADALDGGYAERTQGLIEILGDDAADPIERFLACFALASWADPVGYRAVIEAAAAADQVVWRGASYDRFRSQDDTFGQLAEAVASSHDMVDEQGTATARIQAARALLGIADRVQFDRHLSAILRRDIIGSCINDIRNVIERGIDRLTSSSDTPPFDLGLQIALLIEALHSHDAAAAAGAARRLIAANPGERALSELSGLTGT